MYSVNLYFYARGYLCVYSYILLLGGHCAEKSSSKSLHFVLLKIQC